MFRDKQLDRRLLGQHIVSRHADRLERIDGIFFGNRLDDLVVAQLFRKFFAIQLLFSNGVKAIEQILGSLTRIITDRIPQYHIQVLAQLGGQIRQHLTGDLGILQRLALGNVGTPHGLINLVR